MALGGNFRIIERREKTTTDREDMARDEEKKRKGIFWGKWEKKGSA